MQIETEIYTSAPRLLDGLGHLGIVARTQNFPKDLESHLGFIRNYTLLSAFPVDQPSQHPSRFVLAPIGSWYSITRTVYAGADHTGRTTPLSHHAMIDLNQLRIEKPSIGVLLHSLLPTFKDNWNSPPQILDSVSIDVPIHNNAQSTIESFWPLHLDRSKLAQIVFYIADCVAHYKATQRTVILVTQADASSLVSSMLSNILSLLPSTWQYELSFATHVVQQSDQIRDVALIFTYPSTQFLEAAKRRQDSVAPIIIDLTEHLLVNLEIKYQRYGDILSQLWHSNSREEICEFIKLCNTMNVTIDNFVDAFKVVRMKHEMRSISSVSQLLSISADYERLRKISGVDALLDQYAYDMFRNQLPNFATNEYSRALAFICCNRYWPKELSEFSKQIICNDPAKYISALLISDKSDHDIKLDPKKLLGQLISQQPTVISSLIAKAVSDTNAADLAVNIISRVNVRAETYIIWAEEIIMLDSKFQVKNRLIDQIVKKLCQCSVDDVVSNCRSRFDIYQQHKTMLACEICLPVFKHMIQHSVASSVPNMLTQSFIEIATYMGEEQNAAQILVSSKLKIDDNIVRVWSDIVLSVGGNDAAQRFATELKKLRPAAISESVGSLETPQISPFRQGRTEVNRSVHTVFTSYEKPEIPDSSWPSNLIRYVFIAVSVLAFVVSSILWYIEKIKSLWFSIPLIVLLLIFWLIDIYLNRKKVTISNYRRTIIYLCLIRTVFLLIIIAVCLLKVEPIWNWLKEIV